MVGGQVFGRQEAVMFLHEGIDLLSQSAAVERFTLGAGDFAKRFGHIMALKHIARAQPCVVRRKGVKPALKFRTITILAVILIGFFPQAADVGRNGVTVFSIINSRLHHFFQGQTAETLVHGHPTADSARDIDRLDPIGRNAFKAAFFQFGNGGGFGQRT